MWNYLQRVALSAARTPAGASPARVSPPRVPGPAYRFLTDPMPLETPLRQPEAAAPIPTQPNEQKTTPEAAHPPAAALTKPDVEQPASAGSERPSAEPLP